MTWQIFYGICAETNFKPGFKMKVYEIIVECSLSVKTAAKRLFENFLK